MEDYLGEFLWAWDWDQAQSAEALPALPPEDDECRGNARSLDTALASTPLLEEIPHTGNAGLMLFGPTS